MHNKCISKLGNNINFIFETKFKIRLQTIIHLGSPLLLGKILVAMRRIKYFEKRHYRVCYCAFATLLPFIVYLGVYFDYINMFCLVCGNTLGTFRNESSLGTRLIKYLKITGFAISASLLCRGFDNSSEFI